MLMALGLIFPLGSINPGQNWGVLGGFLGFLALQQPREWDGNGGRILGMLLLPVPRESSPCSLHRLRLGVTCKEKKGCKKLQDFWV